jgi:hypothetical protein
VVSSGIVVGNGGTVICCRSPLVLENGGLAEQVDVETSTGVRVEAELLGSEPTINLAVLRLKPAAGQALGDLVPARIGKVDSLETGDSVFAVADPFGAARTFAPGVVMALPVAACYQADLTGSFIHGSMAISPESVGGALVNAAGEVLGMMVPPPSLQPSERLQPHAYVTYSIQIDTALGVAEAELAEALSLIIWPRGVNRFVRAAECWLGLIRAGQVPASEAFRAWAAAPDQGALKLSP